MTIHQIAHDFLQQHNEHCRIVHQQAHDLLSVLQHWRWHMDVQESARRWENVKAGLTQIHAERRAMEARDAREDLLLWDELEHEVRCAAIALEKLHHLSERRP